MVSLIFQSYGTGKRGLDRAAKGKEVWQVWGWYTFLKRIADAGLFTKAPMSAIESARMSNFWDAMTWQAQEAHISGISSS